ncbi:MAG: TIGR01440 family protein [Clostridiales bacterium]|nr:TIGR01440 family protein [Clostridiales bacterium]MDY4060562.1 TIGR01440 family protein [Anaerovoracaceae bacterium]
MDKSTKEFNEIRDTASKAVTELIEAAHLKKGDILVVGCSSSEIKGERIGKGSDFNAALAVYEGIKPILDEKGIFLAAQGCEHINRAIITERAALKSTDEIVNVVPQVHAGGSFTVAVYENAKDPVALERIQADAGMDIGDTFIGMHLKPVAVPLRLSMKEIGLAHLTCARTRPKFIGGERARYDMVLAGKDSRNV